MAPYSALLYRKEFECNLGSIQWDSWSVGIIILEILVGSDVVANATYFDEVDRILDACEQYLDALLLKYLNELLFCADDPFEVHEMLDYFYENPKAIFQNMKRMEQALVEDGILQDLKFNLKSRKEK